MESNDDDGKRRSPKVILGLYNKRRREAYYTYTTRPYASHFYFGYKKQSKTFEDD